MASRNVSNIFTVRSVYMHDGCHFEGNAACDRAVLYFSEIKCFREQPAATTDEYKLIAATRGLDHKETGGH